MLANASEGGVLQPAVGVGIVWYGMGWDGMGWDGMGGAGTGIEKDLQ